MHRSGLVKAEICADTDLIAAAIAAIPPGAVQISGMCTVRLNSVQARNHMDEQNC